MAAHSWQKCSIPITYPDGVYKVATAHPDQGCTKRVQPGKKCYAGLKQGKKGKEWCWDTNYTVYICIYDFSFAVHFVLVCIPLTGRFVQNVPFVYILNYTNVSKTLSKWRVDRTTFFKHYYKLSDFACSKVNQLITVLNIYRGFIIIYRYFHNMSLINYCPFAKSIRIFSILLLFYQSSFCFYLKCFFTLLIHPSLFKVGG